MSRAGVTIRYDGAVLAGHEMDVADLAPALLALSELCQAANRKFNGNRASVKVLITTDKEHQCFQFDINVVLSYWEQTKALLASEDVRSAAELFGWLGITSGVGAGLLKLLKWLNGRKIDSTKVIAEAGRDFVQINVGGDLILTHQQTYELYKDTAAVKNAKKIVAPLTKQGYETVEFVRGEATEKLNKGDAAAIVATASPGDTDSIDTPQEIIAWIRPYSPVYDVKAPRWRFTLGGVHPYMDITETDIAARAVSRGDAPMNDSYKVRLEIRQALKSDGTIDTTYKIKEVLEYRPAPPDPIQQQMDYDDDSNG